MKTESITTMECFAIWAVIGIVIVGIVESFSFVVFRPLEEDTGRDIYIRKNQKLFQN